MNNQTSLPFKKWSLKFNQCIKCGTTETRHIARGYCKNCYDCNIEGRHKEVNRQRNYGGSSSLLTKEYLLENYITNEKSLGDIAKESNCSRQYVHKRVIFYGIPLRSKSTAREIALDRGKVIRENVSFKGKKQFITMEKVSFNKRFFSSWSSEMAYVLGVIYTDGNLLSRGGSCNMDRFSISQKEPELLIKVLALMECNATIHFRREYIYSGRKAGALHWFSIAENDVYNDLIRLGLTPHKSLTINFPEMPNEYVRHFIRGCWDGDGSVYIDKQSKSITASFVSGSLSFVKGIVSELRNANLPVKTIYANKRKTPSYYFRLTGKQVLNFYYYLYDNVPPTQYLERKFNLFRLSLEMNPKQSTLSLSNPYY